MLRMLLVLATLAVFRTALPAAESIKHEVTVGGQPLLIPPPAGFERLDGVDAKRDAIASELIAASNRMVIAFATPEAVAAIRRGEPDETPRNFNMQVTRSLENRAFTPAQFESYRADVEKDLENLDKKMNAALAKIHADASKSVSEKLRENVEFKIGESVPLGTFERTRDSLGFLVMFKSMTKIAEKETTGLRVVASLIVRVNDRVLYLYSASDRKSEADEVWVKSEALKWRDAIFAANSQTDAPASSTASRLLQQFTFQRILVLVALGTAAGLLIRFLCRHPKSTHPPTA
jgi:hypothetical protein